MGRFFLISSIVLLSVAFLLFFPFWLNADVHYDMNKSKFAFSVALFKNIKLIGGYATTYRGGVALHVSPEKAILIDYSEMNGKRKKFSFMKSFRLKSFVLTTETGAEYLLGVSLAHTFVQTYLLYKRKEKKNVRSNLWLTDGDVLKITGHITLFFNFFILLLEFIKFLKEKIKTICRKKTEKSII